MEREAALVEAKEEIHHDPVQVLPRCSGNRVRESDPYGPYILCLVCGHMAYPDSGKLVEKARPRRTA